MVALGRFEEDTVMIVAVHGDPRGLIPVGNRMPLKGTNVASTVQRTGRSARVDHFEDAPGPIAVMAQHVGLTASVGAPVIVASRRASQSRTRPRAFSQFFSSVAAISRLSGSQAA